MNRRLFTLALATALAAPVAPALVQAKTHQVAIEAVTYGPGLVMLRADSSPAKTRSAATSREGPEPRFAACENARERMSKREGKAAPLIQEANAVPSGVLRLIELRQPGRSSIRP